MDRIPAAATATLARALGAYLRATPPQELPARLRRYQGFRPKALAAHRDELLEVLEDDAMRARILEWLDDRPTLSKGEAQLLRIATERADGWPEQLAQRSSAAPKKAPERPGAGDPAVLDKEKERTRRAREEARRVKDETSRRVEGLRAEIAGLAESLDAERKNRRLLEKEAKTAQGRSQKLRGELDRERRKTKTEVAKTESAVDRVRADLKEARRSLRQREREIAELQTKVERLGAAAKPRPRRAAAPKGPRKPLAVPKGRFEDAPETLDQWLSAPRVELLVDGYNASMAEGGFGNLDLESQRKRLVDEVAKLARRKGIGATIVFDGAEVGSTRRRSRGPVTVHYSRPGEIADDRLIVLLEQMDPVPVVVATSDKELQGRARRLGATVATSSQLLALLR